jgi:chaperonin cofactor prefoldin
MQKEKLQNQLNTLTEQEQIALFEVEQLEARLEMAAAWQNNGCHTDNGCNPTN